MSELEVLEILKALSVKTRVSIIKLIGDRKYCVNAIARRLKITQSAVSQHLKILKESELVFAERYGTIIHYRLNHAKVEEFLKNLNKMLTHQEK